MIDEEKIILVYLKKRNVWAIKKQEHSLYNEIKLIDSEIVNLLIKRKNIMSWILIIITGLMLIGLISLTYKRLRKSPQSDSMLKQRAIFNSNQQLIFHRLCELLPEATILSHVSFNALLTTKYLHTRDKYQNMVADFVILNRNLQIQAIISLDDGYSFKRGHKEHHQNSLLEMAGYRVVHYSGIPDYQQLRHDFLNEESEEMPTTLMTTEKYKDHPLTGQKIRAVG